MQLDTPSRPLTPMRPDLGEPRDPDGDRITLLALGSLVLERRWTLARWVVVVATIAVIPKLFGERQYAATASLIPQAASSQSSLASLAGQFGVTLPGGNQTQSPDFYASLMKTRSQLTLIAHDTFTVPELGNRRVSFYDLYQITPGSTEKRDEDAVATLVNVVGVSVTKPTNIIDVRVVTPWPTVSYEIAKAVVNNIDEFNRRTRQSQASAERKFLEGRVEAAKQSLAEAESRLKQFTASNRTFVGTSDLTLERDRLQRQVQLQQSVYSSLTTAYEDARIREVRDTPVITVIDAPVLPVSGLSRGRVRRGLLGILAGAVLGLLWVLGRRVVDVRRQSGDPDAIALAGIFDNAAELTTHPVRWIRGRRKRRD